MENTRPEFSTQELEDELRHEKDKKNFVLSLRSTVYFLLTVSAAAVLVAMFVMPVLRIYGTSMTPTLHEGNIVLAVKKTHFKTGDVVAFYYNNKVLVKRVVGKPGEWVNIDSRGTVFIDNAALEEPYIENKGKGQCDITLPYQVPDSRVFVMGDNRSVSVDSRSASIGCVAEEQVIGKIVFKIWPLNDFGFVN